MSENAISEGRHAADDSLRKDIKSLLRNGLEVEIEPRAYSHEQVTNVVARLQGLEDDDYINKLIIGGFTLTPYMADDDDKQACETCMYYKVHRRFCEIPELMVPVEPEWSCRLWRI